MRARGLKKLMIGALVIFLFQLGTVLAADAAPPEQSINLITNPSGMGLYTIAVAQGQLITKKTGIRIVVQPSQGPKVIPYILASGDGKLATLSINNTYWAYKGISEYDKPYPFLRVLQAGNENYFAIITKEKSGIKAIPDLKKKRVTYSVTSYMTQLVLETQLQAYGVDPKKDVTIVKTEDNSTALKDLDQGRTDAAACGLGGSKMAELSRKSKIVVLPFDPAKIAFVQKEMIMFPAITPDNLSGIDPGQKVIATPSLLIGHADLSDEAAYQVVRALIENYDELKTVNPVLADWKPEVAARELPVPYHPGAIKYYKEKGFWNSKLDEVQRKLASEK